MAGVACQLSISSSSTLRRVVHRPRCLSGSPEKKTPAVLKSVASSIPTNKDRSKYKNIARDVDDVMEILRSDYGNAYFVTGIFTCAIYSDDCIFEDPTISFKGTELYDRNLRLLVPFLEDASIELQSMEKSESFPKKLYTSDVETKIRKEHKRFCVKRKEHFRFGLRIYSPSTLFPPVAESLNTEIRQIVTHY